MSILGCRFTFCTRKYFPAFFFSKSSAEISHLVKEFIDRSLATMLYLPVAEHLFASQEQNDIVLLLSSSPQFLVAAIGEALQIKFWQGTTYECDKEGRFNKISHIMEGEEKARFVKKWMKQLDIPLSSTIIYSDSSLDLPLLKIAGKPIAVVPGFRFKRFCRRQGWEIMS